MSEPTTATENKPVEAKAPEQAKPEAKLVTQEDVAALVETASKAAIEKATKLANEKAEAAINQRMREAGRILSGEQDKSDPNVDFITRFAQEPIKVITGVKDYAKQEAYQQFKTEAAAERIQTEVAEKFKKEYPELAAGNKAKLVDALARTKIAEGKPLREALEESFKETVSEFGLKSVSDSQREASYALGIPTGGGYVGGGSDGTKAYNAEESAAAFVKGQRARLSSFKRK